MERRQAPRHVAGFEHGQPRARRGVCDAGVSAERVQIHELAHASGGELEERLERRQITDVQDRSHVALEIGCGVGRIPVVRLETAVVGCRIGSAPDEREHVGRKRTEEACLLDVERKQLEEAGSAC